MNKDVEQAVRIQLGHAEDNLYRAEIAFRSADLSVQHGESGKTRGQILAEYREETERWKRALASLSGT